jgi:DNA polymerase-3 subunit alpha
LPLDDAKTFVLICDGKTSGVFQLESDGLKEVLRKLQPDKFEDIIAVNALYRPGPLGSGMVDDYIERRHGRQKIAYLFKELEPILQETYGVIVYQEQVMKIASTIAGYSLGESDILRRAMGKKKAEVMAEQKELFLQKSKERTFDGKKAGELFDLMAYFAGYGFNKSHSAAYALIAYQTAYLKANYLAEFMACLISLEATHPEKMAFYLQEAKEMGLSILPPDINTSDIDFSVRGGALLFGLKGIKNVGLAALENIVQIRAQEPFKDILDFCKRIDLRTSNKRVIEHLVWSGAFDTLPGNRAQKTAELTRIMDLAIERKKAELTGQMDLFGFANNTHAGLDDAYVFSPLEEWTDKEKLEKEKEVVGFYLSAHPLETYSKQLQLLTISSFAESLERSKTTHGTDEIVTVTCGIVKNFRRITTKKGDPMAFVNLEDLSGNAEVILFPRTFKKVEQWLDAYHVFIVKGSVDLASDQKCKIKADEFVPIELFFQEWHAFNKASFYLPDAVTEIQIKELKQTLVKGKIPLELLLNEQGKQLKITTQERIALDLPLIQNIENNKIRVMIEI